MQANRFKKNQQQRIYSEELKEFEELSNSWRKGKIVGRGHEYFFLQLTSIIFPLGRQVLQTVSPKNIMFALLQIFSFMINVRNVSGCKNYGNKEI